MPAQPINPFDPTITDVDAPWRSEAACREQFLEDPAFALKWDSTDRKSVEFQAASEVCKDCPVRYLCVEDAVADPTARGNRGGFAFVKGVVCRTDAARIESELGLTARTRARRSSAALAEAG